MTDVGAPTSLSEIGYGKDDLAGLVPGALDQRRLLVGALTATSNPRSSFAMLTSPLVALRTSDEALRQISSYLASNPQRRPSFAKDDTWELRGLHDDGKLLTAEAEGIDSREIIRRLLDEIRPTL